METLHSIMEPSGIRRQYRGQLRWDGAETEKGRFLELDETGVIAKRSSTYTICAVSRRTDWDAEVSLTDPDRRFGIFPDRKLNENSEARSMMTPEPPSTTTDDFGTQWGFEQSFQSTVFQSFTTKEVRLIWLLRPGSWFSDDSQLFDLGALDPNQTLPRPDLQGDLWQ